MSEKEKKAIKETKENNEADLHEEIHDLLEGDLVRECREFNQKYNRPLDDINLDPNLIKDQKIRDFYDVLAVYNPYFAHLLFEYKDQDLKKIPKELLFKIRSWIMHAKARREIGNKNLTMLQAFLRDHFNDFYVAYPNASNQYPTHLEMSQPGFVIQGDFLEFHSARRRSALIWELSDLVESAIAFYQHPRIQMRYKLDLSNPRSDLFLFLQIPADKMNDVMTEYGKIGISPCEEGHHELLVSDTRSAKYNKIRELVQVGYSLYLLKDLSDKQYEMLLKGEKLSTVLALVDKSETKESSESQAAPVTFSRDSRASKKPSLVQQHSQSFGNNAINKHLAPLPDSLRI